MDVGQRTEAIVLAELVKRGPVRSNTRETFRRSYHGEAELFLVYCPETDRVYAVDIEEAASGIGALRVAPTANSQAKRVRWAADYELPA